MIVPTDPIEQRKRALINRLAGRRGGGGGSRVGRSQGFFGRGLPFSPGNTGLPAVASPTAAMQMPPGPPETIGMPGQQTLQAPQSLPLFNYQPQTSYASAAMQPLLQQLMMYGPVGTGSLRAI